jgi:hypothetical protein
MSEWEFSIGESDEWYTPIYIFEALGETFDIDVASPGNHHWVPAKKVFTKKEDGLKQEWCGFIFMNPPFGKRNGQVPWIEKFISHGNGIGIVAARTSAKWFQDLIPQCDAVLFPRGKTKFIRPNGEIGKSPGSGIVLIAVGARGMKALKESGLGIYIEISQEKAV